MQIPDTSYTYYWVGGQCTGGSSSGQPGQPITVYKIGQEIDATAFVAAAVMTDP